MHISNLLCLTEISSRIDVFGANISTEAFGSLFDIGICSSRSFHNGFIELELNLKLSDSNQTKAFCRYVYV